MSYFTHPAQSGLGIDMDSLLTFVQKMDRQANKQELALVPLLNQTYAIQATAQQATQQTILQTDVEEAKIERADELMKFLPYVLGGLGVLMAAVLVIRARRKR